MGSGESTKLLLRDTRSHEDVLAFRAREHECGSRPARRDTPAGRHQQDNAAWFAADEPRPPGAEVFGAEGGRPELARAACRSAGLRRRRCPGSQRAAAAIPTRLTYPRPSGWRPCREPRRDEPTRRARRAPAERTDCAGVRLRPAREPECRRSDAPGKAVVCSRIPLPHDADRSASNTKCVTRPFPHSTEGKKSLRFAGFSIAGAGFEPATFGL